MSRFEVDTEEVAKASAAANRTAAAIQSEVGTMFTILTNLQSAWRGSASMAFADLAQRWRTTQDHIQAELGEISQALAASAQQYGEVENNTTSLFGR